jgi:hypothetical protein
VDGIAGSGLSAGSGVKRGGGPEGGEELWVGEEVEENKDFRRKFVIGSCGFRWQGRLRKAGGEGLKKEGPDSERTDGYGS